MLCVLIVLLAKRRSDVNAFPRHVYVLCLTYMYDAIYQQQQGTVTVLYVIYSTCVGLRVCFRTSERK